MSQERKHLREHPLQITCTQNGITFTRGIHLGSGHYSTCYEFANLNNKEFYAGKIIPKSMYNNDKLRRKIRKEIEVLNILRHDHIIHLIYNFEDFENYYMIFELCLNDTLRKLLRMRKTITEPEARYFIKQLSNGCSYLHANNIVHGNIKLGNLFITENMILKIGNFGLSKKFFSYKEENENVRSIGEYKEPEMTNKNHSFKIDIWGIGCVLYTLVYGKTPFEMKGKKDVPVRMVNYQLTIPPNGSEDLKELITHLLDPSSFKRPSAEEILKFDFFINNFIPSTLPGSCLQEPPDFSDELPYDKNKTNPLNSVGFSWLSKVYAQLEEVLEKSKIINKKEIEGKHYSSSKPQHFITKWVDYSNNDGLVYQLSDNTSGVIFNDKTSLIIDASREKFKYYQIDNTETRFLKKGCPPDIQKKVNFLMCASQYMNNHLVKPNLIDVDDDDEFNRIPILKKWYRTSQMIVFYLSNETLQVNFFHDHVKAILSYKHKSISIIKNKEDIKNFKLEQFIENGCEEEMLPIVRVLRNVTDKTLIKGLVCSKNKEFQLISGSIDMTFLD